MHAWGPGLVTTEGRQLACAGGCAMGRLAHLRYSSWHKIARRTFGVRGNEVSSAMEASSWGVPMVDVGGQDEAHERSWVERMMARGPAAAEVCAATALRRRRLRLVPCSCPGRRSCQWFRQLTFPQLPLIQCLVGRLRVIENTALISHFPASEHARHPQAAEDRLQDVP